MTYFSKFISMLIFFAFANIVCSNTANAFNDEKMREARHVLRRHMVYIFDACIDQYDKTSQNKIRQEIFDYSSNLSIPSNVPLLNSWVVKLLSDKTPKEPLDYCKGQHSPFNDAFKDLKEKGVTLEGLQLTEKELQDFLKE